MTKCNDELTIIPGVGKSTVEDFKKLGLYKVDDLIGHNPQELYDRLSQLEGYPINRCFLYLFRCAVYFAENEYHDPELLKWWNWKD